MKIHDASREVEREDKTRMVILKKAAKHLGILMDPDMAIAEAMEILAVEATSAEKLDEAAPNGTTHYALPRCGARMVVRPDSTDPSRLICVAVIPDQRLMEQARASGCYVRAPPGVVRRLRMEQVLKDVQADEDRNDQRQAERARKHADTIVAQRAAIRADKGAAKAEKQRLHEAHVAQQRDTQDNYEQLRVSPDVTPLEAFLESAIATPLRDAAMVHYRWLKSTVRALVRLSASKPDDVDFADALADLARHAQERLPVADLAEVFAAAPQKTARKVQRRAARRRVKEAT